MMSCPEWDRDSATHGVGLTSLTEGSLHPDDVRLLGVLAGAHSIHRLHPEAVLLPTGQPVHHKPAGSNWLSPALLEPCSCHREPAKAGVLI